MKLLIVIFIFIILVILIVLKKYKQSNMLLTTFTLVWVFVFITLICFNDNAFQYVTVAGVLIIFANIFMVIFGNLFFLIGNNKNIKPLSYLFKIPVNSMYFVVLFLSVVGCYILLSRINIVEVLINQQLANLRGDLLSHEIVIPKAAVVFLNFLYPFAIVTALYTLVGRKKILVLIFSFLLFVLFSLSTGGKGGIVVLTVLLFGSTIFLIKENILNIDKRLKYVVFLFILLIFLFMAFINSSRGAESESNTEVFVTYFSNSVPAFCQLLNQKEWSLLAFNLNDHSIVRTLSGLLGYPAEWSMDKNIVWVPPNGFNVFTSFADSVFSLGLIGSFVYYFFIGVIMAYANKKSERLNRIFLFSVLFLFSFMSFYVDVFYFLAGSWYCLLFYFFIGINSNKLISYETPGKRLFS